jgi:Raf kinase inhibitor-like YbhB/YbcL family protein
MKKALIYIIIFLIVMLLTFIIFKTTIHEKQSSLIINNLLPKRMNLTSSAFAPNANIPAKYTYDEDNVNPPLTIKDVPTEAKSMALIMDDPDAPMGTWLHWTIWNINPATTEITENSVPTGATEGITDFGSTGYGGPCPPSGTHRYFFKLYALDTEISLPSDAKLKELEQAIAGHILDQAELIGLYTKK